MKRPTCGAVHIFTAGPRDIVDGEWWCHCGFSRRSLSEEWRAIPGWEGFYEVSTLGRVRSLDRTLETVRGPWRQRGRVLSPGMDTRGYQFIGLARGGKATYHRVHRLMALAFLGPEPYPGALVRHLNDVRSDNRIENLAWGTHSDNRNDSVRNGTHANAAKTHCPAGHPYSEQNTLATRKPSGVEQRKCRTCMRERYTARRRRIKQVTA